MGKRRPTRRGCALAGLALASLSLLCTSGCSYLLVQEAPEHPEAGGHFACTASRGLPVVDTVGAGLFALGAGAYVVDPPDPDERAARVATSVGVAVGVAAVFAVSAYYGYGETARCRQAQAELRDRSLPLSPARPPLDRAQAPGCGADFHCKGERICVRGTCLDPREIAPPPPMPEPQAPMPQPAAEPAAEPAPEPGAGAPPGARPASQAPSSESP